MGKTNAHELRGQTPEELLAKVESFRKELAQLRVSQASGQGGASKLSKINVVRKSIAKVLTVYNQSQRDSLRNAYRKAHFVPKDLRQKKTRAIRRRLSRAQQNKMTTRAQKRAQNFPQRKYALRA